MRMTKLYNALGVDIENYPIAEAVIGEDGNLIKLNTGGHKETGQTLTWSIKAEETLAFPFYVADILMDRFEQKDPHAKNRGMERVEGVEEEKEEVVSKPKDGGAICRVCEKSFSSMKGLGLHMSMKHPEEIL